MTTRFAEKKPEGGTKKVDEKSFEKELKAKFSKYRSQESASGSKAKRDEAPGSKQVSGRLAGNDSKPISPKSNPISPKSN